MKKRGVIRLVEVFAAVALLLITFTISQYFIIPPNPKIVRVKSDLEVIGYNALTSIARDGGFDQLLNEPFWTSQLKTILNTILPYGVVFNLTVYKGDPKIADLILIEEAKSISNTNPEVFLYAGEVTQITYIYTSRDLTTYIFELKLAKLGRV